MHPAIENQLTDMGTSAIIKMIITDLKPWRNVYGPSRLSKKGSKIAYQF